MKIKEKDKLSSLTYDTNLKLFPSDLHWIKMAKEDLKTNNRKNEKN